MKQHHYIILFSILYTINILVGAILQNIFYCVFVNGLFSIFTLWFVYLLTQNKESDKPHEPETKEEEQKPIPKPKPKNIKPKYNDNVYDGVIISPDEFKRLGLEEKEKYKQYSSDIVKGIKDINDFLNGE